MEKVNNRFHLKIYMSLKTLLKPKNIAIIGASENPKKVGNILFRNLINDYKGKIYPINPKHKSLLGLKCYPTVDSIKKKIDVAIVVIPAQIIPKVLNTAKNAKNLIIISSGFEETGNKQLASQVLRITQENNQRVLGPNCMGIQIPSLKINATFAGELAKEGNVAFISQSGAFCSVALDWGRKQNIGFSALLSVGNMLDLDFSDFIEYFSKDKNIR